MRSTMFGFSGLGVTISVNRFWSKLIIVSVVTHLRL